jgi:hypothetical protein
MQNRTWKEPKHSKQQRRLKGNYKEESKSSCFGSYLVSLFNGSLLTIGFQIPYNVNNRIGNKENNGINNMRLLSNPLLIKHSSNRIEPTRRNVTEYLSYLD